jgi:rubrerythrin
MEPTGEGKEIFSLPEGEHFVQMMRVKEMTIFLSNKSIYISDPERKNGEMFKAVIFRPPENKQPESDPDLEICNLCGQVMDGAHCPVCDFQLDQRT